MIAACALVACSFDRRELDDRIAACIDAEDCEPDEDCMMEVCLQRACQTPADCGTTYAFTCESGGCLVRECEEDVDCGGGGLTCPDGYCAASFNVVSATSTGNTSDR